MKKSAVFLTVLLVVNSLLLAQPEDKIIAKIGNISISEKEFTSRYELTPMPGMHDTRIGTAMKEKLLYTLIAEKLLALYAFESRLDTNDIVKYTLNAFEKMFTRDALYKAEIKDKAKQKADSLLSVYISDASEYWFIYIYSKEKEESQRIYDLLQKGVPFDSLYSELKTGHSDTSKFKIGDLSENIESELLKIKEQSYSKPMFVNNGWYINKIVKKNSPVRTKMTGWESEYKNLERVAEERAEAELYKNFMTNFFTDKKVRSNGGLLLSTAQKISSIFKEKSKERKSEEDEIYLSLSDLLKIEYEFGSDSINMPYVYLGERTISLKNFLRWFRFESFLSRKVDLQSLTRILNGKTRKFIEEELLAEEGFKRGLNESAYAKESIDMWKQNYLFKIAYANLFDSSAVIDNESISLDGYTGNTEIKIIGILTDSLSVIEKVLDELRDDADISELAEKYSKEKVTGEPEFRPVSSYGEAGTIAARMQPGEVYGPIRMEDGYLVFKLIDKRNKDVSSGASASVDVSQSNKRYQSVMKQVAELADKYSVTLNKDLLKEINRSNINSIIFRNLGFGGRTTAVPFVTPDNTWVKYWEENKANP